MSVLRNPANAYTHPVFTFIYLCLKRCLYGPLTIGVSAYKQGSSVPIRHP